VSNILKCALMGAVSTAFFATTAEAGSLDDYEVYVSSAYILNTQSPGPFVPVDVIEGLRVDQLLGSVVADVDGIALGVDISSLPGCEQGTCVLTVRAYSEVNQEEYLINLAVHEVHTGVDSSNVGITLVKAIDGLAYDLAATQALGFIWESTDNKNITIVTTYPQ